MGTTIGLTLTVKGLGSRLHFIFHLILNYHAIFVSIPFLTDAKRNLPLGSEDR